MSTLQFCSRCDGSVAKTEKLHFTRRREPLCPTCHDDHVREKLQRGKRHLRETVEREPVDRTRQINILLVVTVIVILGGFAALMMTR